MKSTRLLAYLLFALLYANMAFGENTSQIRVTANVIKFCNIRSTPFTFGNYGQKDLIAKAAVTVTCTAGTVFYISINQIGRAMTNDANDILKYSIFQDPGRSKALGNLIRQNTISGVGTGKPEILNIYAVLEGGQSVSKGLYEDKLNISLSF